MCVAFLAWKVSSGATDDVVLLSNRDEFLGRRSEPLHQWRDRPEITAGRDLAGRGGTWLGSGRNHRFGFIVNVREVNLDHGHLSRGELLAGYLSSDCTPAEYCREIDFDRHKGFTLVLCDQNEAFQVSNRGTHRGIPMQLNAGSVYGFTNGVPGEPEWPKVSHGIAEFERLVRSHAGTAEYLKFMTNEELDFNFLPNTGYGAIEYALSSRFIGNNPVYGTRVVTILRRDSPDDGVLLEEFPVVDGRVIATEELDRATGSVRITEPSTLYNTVVDAPAASW